MTTQFAQAPGGGGGTAGVQVMDKSQFLAQGNWGGPLLGEEQGWLGRSGRPNNKAQKRRKDRMYDAMLSRTAIADKAWRDALASGKVREPTDTERLHAAAKGMPDLPSTQAALRVIAKRAARAAAAKG